jgi:hypothetical protein
MEQQRLELVKIKEGLIKENAQKKDELRKMDEKLEMLVESLKSAGDALVKDI